MEVTEIQTILIFCMELAGTIAFAASGAMVGIHCRMDIFGVCVLGVMTAVGGGMTRDVILGNVPGALVKPVYVLAAVITALFVFIVLYFRKNVLKGRFGIVYDRIMLVMDSLGLGIFTVMGVMTGMNECLGGLRCKVFRKLFSLSIMSAYDILAYHTQHNVIGKEDGVWGWIKTRSCHCMRS